MIIVAGDHDIAPAVVTTCSASRVSDRTCSLCARQDRCVRAAVDRRPSSNAGSLSPVGAGPSAVRGPQRPPTSLLLERQVC